MPDTNLVAQQKAVCKKYGSAFTPCHDGDKVGIALGTLDLVPFHGVRLTPENGTCGWYFWGGENSGAVDFYAPVHLAHLPDIAPMFQKYLALAPGFKFIIDRAGYEDVYYEPHAPAA